jgi:hypothetical protein
LGALFVLVFFRALLNSVSESSFDLDVFSERCARLVACYLLLPVIGGMRCVFCFNRLVAFQSEQSV